MILGSKALRIAAAVGSAAVLSIGAVLVATASEAAPARTNQQATSQRAVGPAGTTALEQCQRVQLVNVGNGWTIPVPMTWESNAASNCNLKYGDLPHRYPQYPEGYPDRAIRQLQHNLNFCYGSTLTIDGKYGSSTRAAVTEVQRKHRITADGIYGPATKSAMNWRLYHPAKRIWSTNCYSPL